MEVSWYNQISKIYEVIVVWVFCMSIVDQMEALTQGRNANPGEFPYVVRIYIPEKASGMHFIEYGKVHSSNHHVKTCSNSDYGTVATGVLLTSSRVLTTCDSVGFFTYDRKVKYYNTTLVSIMGGSVERTGEGGVWRTPVNSSVHPHCYFLMSGYVLHNYGFYEVTPFPNNSHLIEPIDNSFGRPAEMEAALRRLYTGGVKMECSSASWGFPSASDSKSVLLTVETSSKILQTTKMTLVDYDYCYEQTCAVFNDCFVMIWEYGYVCAEAEDGGPCLNDNGAPLVCDGQLYAIHNNPLNCDDRGFPRHFARIDLAFDYVFNVNSRSQMRTANFTTVALLAIQAVDFTRFLLHFTGRW